MIAELIAVLDGNAWRCSVWLYDRGDNEGWDGVVISLHKDCPQPVASRAAIPAAAPSKFFSQMFCRVSMIGVRC